jgi:hypothetical protein
MNRVADHVCEAALPKPLISQPADADKNMDHDDRVFSKLGFSRPKSETRPAVTDEHATSEALL